jgi:hypothetical protein
VYAAHYAYNRLSVVTVREYAHSCLHYRVMTLSWLCLPAGWAIALLVVTTYSQVLSHHFLELSLLHNCAKCPLYASSFQVLLLCQGGLHLQKCMVAWQCEVQQVCVCV